MARKPNPALWLIQRYTIPPKVDIEKREYTVPLVYRAVETANNNAVGPVATWIRETIQNSIPTEYLRGQTAGLLSVQVWAGGTEEEVSVK
jgi:hypothetical protein